MVMNDECCVGQLQCYLDRFLPVIQLECCLDRFLRVVQLECCLDLFPGPLAYAQLDVMRRQC